MFLALLRDSRSWSCDDRKRKQLRVTIMSDYRSYFTFCTGQWHLGTVSIWRRSGEDETLSIQTMKKRNYIWLHEEDVGIRGETRRDT
jgi:hypothetical protein